MGNARKSSRKERHLSCRSLSSGSSHDVFLRHTSYNKVLALMVMDHKSEMCFACLEIKLADGNTIDASNNVSVAVFQHRPSMPTDVFGSIV